MVGNAGEHVGEPGLRVDGIEPRRSEPQNSHALRPSGTQRSGRSAALFERQTRPSSRKRVKASQRRSMELMTFTRSWLRDSLARWMVSQAWNSAIKGALSS